jgi:hypothetical protein
MTGDVIITFGTAVVCNCSENFHIAFIGWGRKMNIKVSSNEKYRMAIFNYNIKVIGEQF